MQTDLKAAHMFVACFVLAAALDGAHGRLQATSRHLLQLQPTTPVFLANLSAFDDGALDCAAEATRCTDRGQRIPEYSLGLDVRANITVGSPPASGLLFV